MKGRRLLGAALGLALVVVAGWAALQGLVDEGGEWPLAYHTGGELAYTAEGGGSTIRIRTVDTVEVVNQDGATVTALPMITEFATGGGTKSELSLVDVATGELVFNSAPCVLSVTPECGEDIVQVNWERCALNSPVAPAALLPLGTLDAGMVTLEDPLMDVTWTYEVARESDHLRIALVDQTRPTPQCRPAEHMHVDPDRGLVTAFGLNGHAFNLVAQDAGTGKRVPVGGGEPASRVALDARVERAAPYPPGTGSFGPEAWPLRDAWEAAENESPTLRAFAEEGEVFVRDASLTVSGSDVGSETYWTFEVLRVDGHAMRVESRRVCIGEVCRTEVEAERTDPPPGTPSAIVPPADELVDFGTFVTYLDNQGWTEEVRRDFGFTVSFDHDRAAYVYLVHRHFEEDAATSATRSTSHFVSLVADTGRLESAHLTPAAIDRLFVQTPEEAE